MTTHDSALYEAATNALASEASSENTWTKMVTASFPYATRKDFEKELKAVELLIKKEYGMTSMPTSWRSAKSIVLGAMKHEISLSDDNGHIKGKSAIQEALKDHKVTSSAFQLAKNALKAFSSQYVSCETVEEKKSLYNDLLEISMKIKIKA
jgi:hypothetical protein